MAKAMELWVGEMKKMSEKINTRNPLMQRKNSTSVVSKQQQGSEEESNPSVAHRCDLLITLFSV